MRVMVSLSHPYPNRKAILARLDALGIFAETFDHIPVFTVAESEGVKAAIEGAHTKNLFVKEKSKGEDRGRFFLICARSDTPVPMKTLHHHLGCRRLSFGAEEDLIELLGVRPGSVTLFAIANDVAGRVTLIIDQALAHADRVNFHPMINSATTRVSAADMLGFAAAHNHTAQIIDFSQLSAQESGEK